MASNRADEYDREDTTTDDLPQGGDTVDNSYATSGSANESIPVVKDDAPVDQPNDGLNPDSDEALGIAPGPFYLDTLSDLNCL